MIETFNDLEDSLLKDRDKNVAELTWLTKFQFLERGTVDLSKLFAYGCPVSILLYVIQFLYKEDRLNFDIKELNVPEGVTYVPAYFLSCCQEDLIVHLPSTVRVVEESAFSNWEGELKVTLPNTIEQIHRKALYNVYRSDCTVYAFDLDLSDEKDPLIYAADHRVVVGVKRGYQDLITEIKVPDGVRVILDSAFAGCSRLGKVALPDSIHSIGETAFVGTCVSSIRLPKGLKYTADSALARLSLSNLDLRDFTEDSRLSFSGVGGFKSIFIPRTFNVTDRCFVHCSALQRVKIEEGVSKIGKQAFRNTPLSSIELPDSIREIGDGAFSLCRRLRKITLPSNLEVIPYELLSESGILSIEIPKGVRSIESGAFECCKNLREVILPEGLESIGEGAFLGCPKLSTIYIPESVTQIDVDALGYYPISRPVRYDEISNNWVSPGDMMLDYEVQKKFQVECKRGTVAEQYALTNGIDILYRD